MRIRREIADFPNPPALGILARVTDPNAPMNEAGPTLSVVVPVYDSAAYLSQAITSALGQSHPPLELVLVDDGSTDDSVVIAAHWARRHPRVRLIRHHVNRGPGVARNTGLAACEGDYVFFLDADDLVSPGSFELLRELLRETNRPDAVITDLAFHHPCGITRLRGLPDRVVAGVGADLSISAEPDLVDVSWAVANKVCRRSFLVESAIEFPGGIYEDMPWSFRIMLTAERIRVLDHPLVNYRRCQRMSITSAVNGRHLDFLTQCGNLIDWLDRTGADEAVSLRVVDKLRGYAHYLESGQSGRIPAELLDEMRGRAESVFRGTDRPRGPDRSPVYQRQDQRTGRSRAG